MDEHESLSHSKWECKYHVVFIPKCRRKVLYAGLRQHLGEVFRRLAEQKESRIEEGRLLPDHVHMMILIPPKYAVSQVIGFIKGKSAIHLARVYGERKLCEERVIHRKGHCCTFLNPIESTAYYTSRQVMRTSFLERGPLRILSL